MKTIAVNDSHKFEIEEADSGLLMDGEPVSFNLQQLSNGHFHVLLYNASYTTEVVSLDRKQKEALIKVNGTVHKMFLSDQYDDLLKGLGLSTSSMVDA